MKQIIYLKRYATSPKSMCNKIICYICNDLASGEWREIEPIIEVTLCKKI